MPLSYHKTVDAFSTHGTDSKSVTKTKLNANFTVAEGNEQGIENRFENTFYDAFGSGILLGLQPTPTYGGGLGVDVTAGVALVGYVTSIEATTVTITASMATGYIYLKQDGTFYDAGATATPPAGVSSFLYATYSSDGYDCLIVTLSTCGVQFARIDADVIGTVTAGVIKRTVVERDLFVESVEICVGDADTYETLYADVHTCAEGGSPTTIFTTQANRPNVAALAGTNQLASGTPNTRIIAANSVLTIEVDGAVTDAQDLSVVIKGRWCDIA